MMATAKRAVQEGAPVSFGDLGSYTAGGSIPEGDYILKDFNLQMYQAEKKDGTKAGAARLGVMITLATIAKPDEDLTKFLSLGSKAHESFAAAADGKSIIPVPGGPGGSLNISTNWAIFLKSMYDCGLPQGYFTTDLSVLDGCHVHLANVPEPEERKGFQTAAATGEAAAEERKPQTTVIVTEFKDGGKPWEGPVAAAPKGKAAPAKAAAPAPAAEEAPADDVETEAITAISSVLAKFEEEGKPLTKLLLRTSTYAAISNKKVANAVTNAYFTKDEHLNGILEQLGYKLVGSAVKPA